MTDYVKYGLIVLLVGFIYWVGYQHAESEGEALLESLKVQHAQAIIDAQNKEQKKYEKTIASLTTALNSARSERDSRMHELEGFRARETDYGTCRRQRDSLARIAVGLESVASRAVLYLEGGTK